MLDEPTTSDDAAPGTPGSDAAVIDPTPAGPSPQTETAPIIVIPDDDTSRYYRFKDEHGVTADGNLEPLVSIGMTVAIPTMIDNPETGRPEPGETISTLHLQPGDSILSMAIPARIVPGTRMVESADPRVDSALLASGKWEQIDKPTKKEQTGEAKALTAAIDEAANRSDEER